MHSAKIIAAQIATKSALVRQKAVFTSSATFKRRSPCNARNSSSMSTAAAGAGAEAPAQQHDPAPPPLLPPEAQKEYRFGPWPIGASEVFARTALSYAFVNLKPLVPGLLR
jgi:hypothetical protein